MNANAMPRREKAVGFLSRLLADGPATAEAVKNQARATGVSVRTLLRAKAALGVKAEKVGFTGGWHWRLDGTLQPKNAKSNEEPVGLERPKRRVAIHIANPCYPVRVCSGFSTLCELASLVIEATTERDGVALKGLVNQWPTWITLVNGR